MSINKEKKQHKKIFLNAVFNNEELFTKNYYLFLINSTTLTITGYNIPATGHTIQVICQSFEVKL